ncbi:transposable element Tc3 transposase [Trichonephila clavipes]|nr:transposable element Tc3 transposase [Trichonephila clavipes]
MGKGLLRREVPYEQKTGPYHLPRKNEHVSFIAYYFAKNGDSDEAHFWLNGYVNKQNCRIWSEANPHVYVETPLHPEKLTVWCALWAGGILLQKR